MSGLSHLLSMALFQMTHFLVYLEVELRNGLPKTNLGILLVGREPQVEFNILEGGIKEDLWLTPHRL